MRIYLFYFIDMKAEIKLYDGIWFQLEVQSENDLEKYAIMTFFEGRQPDFIVIK